MDNCKCKVMPGFEQYQSAEAQREQMLQDLGFSNPNKFNPSNQEVSLADRTASKMSPEEIREHRLEPLELFPVVSPRMRRRK